MNRSLIFKAFITVCKLNFVLLVLYASLSHLILEESLTSLEDKLSCDFRYLNVNIGYLVNQTFWISDADIGTYWSYSSFNIYSFLIPEDSVASEWELVLSKSSAICSNKKVLIYINYRGYPVVFPMSETIPKNFFLDGSHLIEVAGLQADRVPVKHVISYPLPGRWFLVLAFEPVVDRKLSIQGLDICEYELGLTFNTITATDIPVLLPESPLSVSIDPHETKFLRFLTLTTTRRYSVVVSKCQPDWCSVKIYARSRAIPTGHEENSTYCGRENSPSPCVLNSERLATGEWEYLRIESLTSEEKVNFSLTVAFQNCHFTSKALLAKGANESRDSCLMTTDMKRFTSLLTSAVFKYTFQNSFKDPVNIVDLSPSDTFCLFKFDLEDLANNGETLKVTANLLSMLDTSDVHVCISKWTEPNYSESKLHCPPNQYTTVLKHDTNKQSTVYFPYPQTGSWYIAFSTNFPSGHDKSSSVRIEYSVSLSPCLDNDCSGNGVCRVGFSGPNLISFCSCNLGYRGYACTDDSQIISRAKLLARVLLPTLTNLFFIPSIYLSFRRRFYIESFVYLFTMFFSTFYHACDQPSDFTWCLMKYGTAQYGDFFGSIASFWVTIIAMARLPIYTTAFLDAVGLICIAVGTFAARFNFFTFVAQFVVSLIIMASSWIYRCVKSRSVYPSKKRITRFLIPGIVLALVGLIIFASLETHSNYLYTHSFWHFCVAISIVFLLPSKGPHKPPTIEILDLLKIKKRNPHDDTSAEPLNNEGNNAANAQQSNFPVDV